MNKQKLFQVAIPNKTATYQPISHKNIYDATMEQLDKFNLEVVSENMIVGSNGMKLINKLTIASNLYEEFNMQIAYRNSYDKSMSVGFTSGAVVMV